MPNIKKFRILSFKKQKPAVKIDKISVVFGKRQILDNVSFNINPGEILGLLGPNGVGKSTIFNLITGLIKPNYGKIFNRFICKRNYPIYLRTTKFKIGYVPQHGGFFHDLTLVTLIPYSLLPMMNLKEFLKLMYLISKFELDAVIN